MCVELLHDKARLADSFDLRSQCTIEPWMWSAHCVRIFCQDRVFPSIITKESGELFLAYLDRKCSESAIVINHRPLESAVRASVHIFHVYTPASTNVNQSAPNLVTIYMTIKSRMITIMYPIRQENWSYLPLNWKNCLL